MTISGWRDSGLDPYGLGHGPTCTSNCWMPWRAHRILSLRVIDYATEIETKVEVKGVNPSPWGGRFVACLIEDAKMIELRKWGGDHGVQHLQCFQERMRFWTPVPSSAHRLRTLAKDSLESMDSSRSSETKSSGTGHPPGHGSIATASWCKLEC